MEFLGYNNATIELHKDSIGLQHPILNQNQDLYDKDFINYYEKRIEKPAICLRGHTHENLFYINNNIPIICTPALFNNSSKQLGAWDITLYFNYLSKIESIELQSLEVDPKINSTVRILHKFN